MNDYNYAVDVLKRAHPNTAPYMISVPRGWTNLVLGLHAQLLELDPDYSLFQVKEKFGGLRFYICSVSSESHIAVREAEKISYYVCETCGMPGKLRDDLSWITTLCDEHYEEYLEQQF